MSAPEVRTAGGNRPNAEPSQEHESADCHSAPDGGQALTAIDADRKAFETLRAAAARQGIAVYELTNGELLVCKWGMSRAMPLDALAAFLAPMGVRA